MRELLVAYRGVLRSYYGQLKERKENPYLLYRFVYRPLSFPLSAVAIRLGVSADALTAMNFLVLAAALAALARGQLLLGAWLYFLYYVLDFADGNIARYHGVSSYFGKLVDGMVDTVSYLTFAAAAWGNARAGASWIGAEIEVFVGVAATISALLRQNYQWRMSALKSEIRLLSPAAESRPAAEVPMRPVVRLFNNLACSAPLVLLVAAYLDAVSLFLVAFFLLYGFAGNLEIVIGILKNRGVLTARREH